MVGHTNTDEITSTDTDTDTDTHLRRPPVPRTHLPTARAHAPPCRTERSCKDNLTETALATAATRAAATEEATEQGAAAIVTIPKQGAFMLPYSPRTPPTLAPTWPPPHWLRSHQLTMEAVAVAMAVVVAPGPALQNGLRLVVVEVEVGG